MRLQLQLPPIQVSALSELTTRTVRDRLARLSQMSLLLGLENVDELLDYWPAAAGGTTSGSGAAAAGAGGPGGGGGD